jgi:hypothetical protein
VINASGTELNANSTTPLRGQTGAFYVSPIRNFTQSLYLGYNTTTKEISYFESQGGSEGPQGYTGPEGVTGSQGPQGYTGPTGVSGSQGPQGYTGPTGLQGANGVVAATGIAYGDYLLWNGTQWTGGLQASSSIGKQTNSIAIGYQAGYSNQGTSAIAIGFQAGFTGQSSNSISIGTNAGKTSLGKYCVAIGYDASCSITATGSVAIGYKAYASDSKKIVLGDAYLIGVFAHGGFNVTSDYRFKDYVTPIKETTYSVDHLKPIVYQNKYNKTTNMGFLAHELQEHIPFLVTNQKDDEKGHQTINYDGLIGLCVKEIQDLKRELKEIKAFLQME